MRINFFIIVFICLNGQNLIADPLYQWVDNVFDNLIEANGSWIQEEPHLTIIDREKLHATRSISSVNSSISLDFNILKVCESFGRRREDAIALILGDKLIRYYNGKSMSKEVVGLVEDDALAKQNFFLVNKAGYYTRGILSDLILKLQVLYPNETTIGVDYQNVISKALSFENEIRYLTSLMEMADYLALINDYEAAIDCYQKILSDVELKEVHNNLGILQMRQAISFSAAEQWQYIYPLEMDMVSPLRFRHPGEAVSPEEKVKIVNQLTLKAKSHFIEAQNIDEGYVAGLINLACLYHFEGNKERAEMLLGNIFEILQKQPHDQSWNNAQLIKGIIRVGERDYEAAGNIFREIEKSRFPHLRNLAKHNRYIIENKEIEYEEMDKVLGFWEEKISNISLAEFSYNPVADTLVPIQSDTLKRYMGIKQMEKSHLYFLKSTTNSGMQRTISFHVNEPDYLGMSHKKIAIGDPESKIYANYKSYPEWVRYAADGTFLIYSELGLIFRLDEERFVKSWCVFHLD